MPWLLSTVELACFFAVLAVERLFAFLAEFLDMYLASPRAAICISSNLSSVCGSNTAQGSIATRQWCLPAGSAASFLQVATLCGRNLAGRYRNPFRLRLPPNQLKTLCVAWLRHMASGQATALASLTAGRPYCSFKHLRYTQGSSSVSS